MGNSSSKKSAQLKVEQEQDPSASTSSLIGLKQAIAPPFAAPKLLRWAYCTQCVSAALAQLPYWAHHYRHSSTRPRSSWSLSETLLVRFTRHVAAMTEEAGHQHATRNPNEEPEDKDRLKETTFKWVPGDTLQRYALLKGILDDEYVKPLERVGTFIWGDQDEGKQVELEYDDDDNQAQWVGIYLHGGGYTHFSAHESAQTSQIPRRLMASGRFSSIHAVEYRLINHGPFPAALQDVATVYAHLIKDLKIASHRIVIIGDSAGGNIALAVARWIRDEEALGKPGGLLLLSPWCDPSHSFPYTASALVPRPNASTDYLRDSPTARALLVRTFLGHHPHAFVEDPYISPASPLGPHGSFVGFPRTFVNYSDAERLESEIDMLVKGLQRDKVNVEVEKTKDAPHDVLMVHFWNENVRAKIYDRVVEWLDVGRNDTRPANSRAPSVAENLI